MRAVPPIRQSDAVSAAFPSNVKSEKANANQSNPEACQSAISGRRPNGTGEKHFLASSLPGRQFPPTAAVTPDAELSPDLAPKN